MSRLVLDASVALCWCFEDQSTGFTEAVLDRFARGDEGRVPSIWPLEVANALVVAERRKLITSAKTTGFLEQLMALPIRTDSPEAERAFGHVLEFARRYRLSAYDASYLELAARQGLPLATMDVAIRSAAHAAGVKLLTAG